MSGGHLKTDHSFNSSAVWLCPDVSNFKKRVAYGRAEASLSLGNREFKHQWGYNGVGMRFLCIQGLKQPADQILSMDKFHSFNWPELEMVKNREGKELQSSGRPLTPLSRTPTCVNGADVLRAYTVVFIKCKDEFPSWEIEKRWEEEYIIDRQLGCPPFYTTKAI